MWKAIDGCVYGIIVQIRKEEIAEYLSEVSNESFFSYS